MVDFSLLRLGSGACLLELDWVDPEVIFCPHADKPFAVWLDSSADSHPDSRYSYIAIEPYQVMVDPQQEGDSFTAVDGVLLAAGEVWQGLPSEYDGVVPPFRGGAVGVFSYDLARELEDLPPAEAPFAIDDQHLPKLAVGFYGTVVAFDHLARRVFVLATGLPASSAVERRGVAVGQIEYWQQQWQERVGLPSLCVLAEPLSVVSNFTRAGYERGVQAIIEHIRSGDAFQVNLSQRWSAELAEGEGAFVFYRRLRRSSPAPFSCFMRFEDWAVASASPERFLWHRGGVVETKPIKGTCRRGRTQVEDIQLAQSLLASEKDRAENVMIVDLLRNDLSRICFDESVRVPEMCSLESFSNVHHLVSRVVGQMDGRALDLLRVCFPGGSITGAPKIRAMELIAQYEPTVRGPYYGSIGFVGFDNTMDVNIAIRTALFCRRSVSFQVGGGLTLGSSPSDEYDETMTKATGLLTALGWSGQDLEGL